MIVGSSTEYGANIDFTFMIMPSKHSSSIKDQLLLRCNETSFYMNTNASKITLFHCCQRNVTHQISNISQWKTCISTKQFIIYNCRVSITKKAVTANRCKCDEKNDNTQGILKCAQNVPVSEFFLLIVFWCISKKTDCSLMSRRAYH